MTPENRKFTFQEIVSDAPDVIKHDLNFQMEKKRRKRGGANEAAALKRAELAAFDLIVKKLNEINERLSMMEGKL